MQWMDSITSCNSCNTWVVVVAQLAERSLPIPEVRGSNPDNGKFYRTFIIYCQLYCIEKTKIKEKEARNGPVFKKTVVILYDGDLHAVG